MTVFITLNVNTPLTNSPMHVPEPHHENVSCNDWEWVRQNVPEDCVKYDDCCGIPG